MKTIITSYTFDASLKTITFDDYATIELARVLLISNVTDNEIIYNFADPAKGGSAATNVLTLVHDTTAQDDADKLQIFYDDDAPQAVGGLTEIIPVTLTCFAGAISSGNVLADTQVVTDFFRTVDGTAVIQSIVVIDEDDLGLAMDLLFADVNTSIGTEGSAPSVSDAGERDSLGHVSITTNDYIDLGGVREATVKGIGLTVQAISGTRDLAIAGIARGAGTYTASGVRLRIGTLQD